MKHLFICLLTLLLALSSLPAQIYADFSTSLGDFTVELDHLTAPRTVARFLLHAEGTASWIDEPSGSLRTAPFYDGLLFHRAVNKSGFKVIQSGSQSSTGRRSIGFVLPDDELARTHESYVISMANRGPNTNSSEFFVVGNEPAVGLDVPARHIVFGQVPATDSSGRATIDAIVASVASGADAAPDPPVILNSIRIRRENGVTFDPNAQGVPVLSAHPFAIRYDGTDFDLVCDQPPRSILSIDHSGDLNSWSSLDRFLDATAETEAFFRVTEFSTGPSWFYRTFLTTYPEDGIFPDDMESRSLTLTVPSVGGTFVFDFGPDGVAGTWTLESAALAGDIVDSVNTPDPYGTDSILLLSGVNYQFVRFRLGLDSSIPSEISGRASGRLAQTQSDLFAPIPIFPIINIDGTFTLSR